MSELTKEFDQRRLLSAIAAELKIEGWEVYINRTIGLYQVDLLTTAPNGHQFAVELKVFPGNVHFATLNNVAALRSGLAAFGELRVTPVLLAVGTATAALHELAKRLDVSLAVSSPTNDQSATKDLFVTHMKEAARTPFDPAVEGTGLFSSQPSKLLDETASKELAERIHIVDAPETGLFRAGRWSHIDVYPPPPRRTLLDMSEPMLYGGRWADPFGVFSTVTLSTTAEGAIGLSLARYRRATPPEGRGIIDMITSFLTGPPDSGEPSLTEGTVPADVFDDLVLLHVRFTQPPQLVDLDASATRVALAEQLRRLNFHVGTEVDFARTNDRRVTWLAIRALYEACAQLPLLAVAGVLYQDAIGRSWQSVSAWSPPTLVPLVGDSIDLSPLSKLDHRVEHAAEQLALSLP